MPLDQTTVEDIAAKAAAEALRKQKEEAAARRKEKAEEKKSQKAAESAAWQEAFNAKMAGRHAQTLAEWRIADNDFDGEIPADRPQMPLVGSEYKYLLDEIEELIRDRQIRLFVNQGVLTFAHTVKTMTRGGGTSYDFVLSRPNADALRETLGTVVEMWTAGKDEHPTSCPRDLASMYHHRGHWPGLRQITGTTNAPLIRPDGSLLCKPGYDKATGIVYQPRADEVWPEIKDEPDVIDAIEALWVIEGAIKDFPFASDLDKAIAIQAILTACNRPMLDRAPATAVAAPVAQTGKTELCNTISVFALGYAAPPITFDPNSDQEFRKTLETAVIEGRRCIVVDNVDDVIYSVLLNALLTSGEIELRVMGAHNMRRCSTDALFLLNGNGIPIEGDLATRVLKTVLDTGVEDPNKWRADRGVTRDAHLVAIENRPKLVSAALTIMRAHITANSPAMGGLPTRFPIWQSRVRDAMMWVGLPDVAEGFQLNRAADPEAARVRTAYAEIHQAMHGMEAYTTEDIFARMVELIGAGKYALRDALAAIAPDGRGYVAKDKLPYWLRDHVNQIQGGLVLRKIGMAHAGYARWRVEAAAG